MRAILTGITGVSVLLPCALVGAETAELSVSRLTLKSGTTGEVIVSGLIDGDLTFGVTVMAEIYPRPGCTGTLLYTSAPPVDVAQIGDPWPEVGTFNAFDTNALGFSATLNGSVDDNGTWFPGSVTFDGPLTSLPVMTSEDATGTWDVVLSTSAGDSGWEGLPTRLRAGTITVVDPSTIPTVSTWGLTVMALLVLTTGTLMSRRKPAA